MEIGNEGRAPPRTIWQLDPAHTLVELAARHMTFTTMKGRFRSIRGTILLDSADPSRSTVEAEIDAASLDTGVASRAIVLDVELTGTGKNP